MVCPSQTKAKSVNSPASRALSHKLGDEAFMIKRGADFAILCRISLRTIVVEPATWSLIGDENEQLYLEHLLKQMIPYISRWMS
jgi:hypothetical protein